MTPQVMAALTCRPYGPCVTTTATVGPLLRSWREQRRLSQLALADGAEVSTRHLSCVETGRARPSRGFLLHLAEHLDLPLRARNELLVAGGYAPVYGQTDLDAPGMNKVRQALDLVLQHAEPYPALVVDRRWDLVRANSALGLLLEGVHPALLEPPVNVLRVSLHPDGLQPRLEDFGRYSSHVLAVLRREAAVLGDPALLVLHDELAALPGVQTAGGPEPTGSCCRCGCGRSGARCRSSPRPRASARRRT